MDAQQAPRAHDPAIARLPVEILQDIFRRVAENSTSTRNIRLTSRFWRDVVAADNSLLRKLALRDSIYCANTPQIHKEDWEFCVHTPKGLFKALGSVDAAYFHFHVDLNEPIPQEGWEQVPWHRFETQCSALFITSIRRGIHPAVATVLENLPPLRSLQQLSSFDNSMVFPSLPLPFIPPISINSPILRSLTWLPQGTPAFDLEPFRCIFENIRAFTLSCFQPIPASFLVTLFSSFRKLECLSWSMDLDLQIDAEFIRRQVDWKVKLRSLSVTSSLLSAFPPPVLSELTVLACNYGFDRPIPDPSSESEYERCHLPCLDRFTLSHSWSGLIEVDAPQLRHLSLTGSWSDPDYLAKTTLNPISMDIWDAHSGEVLAILFAQRTFTNLIDLCIEVDIQGEEEVDNLVHLFSVHIVEFSSLFPRLENLDIRLHTPDPEEFVAEEAKQKLAKILDTSPYLVSIS